jgi:hypothetical protein
MRLLRLAIVMALGLLLAGVATAQGPGGPPFGGFGGGLAGMLGTNKQLQDELKMDKDQVEKLNQAFAKVRDDLKDDMAKLRERGTTPEERTEIFKKLNDANAKAVDSVLKPEQVKRLHQIENQQAGTRMFAKEDVQKALKLSDSQKEKIKGINDDLQKEMRELFQAGPGPDTMKKQQGLQKEAADNILKVLNDDQKAALKDLKGEPFELARGGFGGPGGFGPGGPGGPGGGFGGPPQPGMILPPFIQDRLKLTDEQKKKLEELQKDVDSKLGKILTDDQKKQLKDMQEGRGGPGGRGPGGRGGPGQDGPPPPPN